jgi:hypothetical protein
MSAAAVIAIRRRRLIRAFREADATKEDHAVTLEEIGQRRSWIFEQMVKCGVFVRTGGGNYFMDEQAAVKFQTRYRKRALVFVAVFLLLAGIIWALRH